MTMSTCPVEGQPVIRPTVVGRAAIQLGESLAAWGRATAERRARSRRTAPAPFERPALSAQHELLRQPWMR
ncbi:hypothetical protein [Desertivibrio insolitus]|uniref:hypothetical protein n=1 Tax=Herbiconiux sp. SYSU D00978 TaxID=2812562 RepID=UPI001A97A543|nr:hypothetical protein [Herbiconiux sp. SYSU D00978]